MCKNRTVQKQNKEAYELTYEQKPSGNLAL